ncbi:hypothetical protein OG874_01505 [Nocardia sp. NBC_00565]|uniref:hypothetical protein n=1 Tax=Nocardia sp. NBC_00565 TaxID=2975993 RepID=UPI002E816D3B|nr:hypothetical protein [Nocardia sp. NBC_00565]WUC08357.1 hypothetical protein OG874_01505 [Nocardia sp. NBC_00565]
MGISNQALSKNELMTMPNHAFSGNDLHHVPRLDFVTFDAGARTGPRSKRVHIIAMTRPPLKSGTATLYRHAANRAELANGRRWRLGAVSGHPDANTPASIEPELGRTTSAAGDEPR